MLIRKHKRQVNNLVRVSNTNTCQKLGQNYYKDTANRPKSATEVQNKQAILIKM